MVPLKRYSRMPPRVRPGQSSLRNWVTLSYQDGTEAREEQREASRAMDLQKLAHSMSLLNHL
jgi:hypothetical protein